MPWVKHRSRIDFSALRASLRHPAFPFALAMVSALVLGVAFASVLRPHLGAKTAAEPMAAVLLTTGDLPETTAVRIRRRFSNPDEVAFGATHVSHLGGLCGWVWDSKGVWRRFISFDNVDIIDSDEAPDLFERRWEARC
jgi:hypothetical protein